MKGPIVVLFSGFLLVWGGLLFRAATLQIFPDHRLEQMKRRQFETSLEIRTRRGAILDRNGKELAASVPAFSLFADPKVIENAGAVAQRLSRYLGLSAATLKKTFAHRNRRFVWIKRQLNEKQRDEIKSWNTSGLGFIEEPKRIYPNGSLLSQVLGFVGSDGKGLDGLELQFNKQLEGKLKQIILPRDARGRPLLADGRSLTEVPDGADLELTIDHEIQFMLERELAAAVEKFGAVSANGVIVDSQTSEILAIANLPTVDLNEGTRVPEERRRNHVVTDSFEPGSTMKTLVITGALRDQLLKPSSLYNCEGGHFKVGDKWISEADTNHKFNWLNVSEILAYSSNIGATKIAFQLGDQEVRRTLLDFGISEKTGISLPGEARGILNPLPWRPHLLSNISFGHGVAVTPLQMAVAYTAIANGGMLKKPLLVRAIRDHDQKELTEFHAEDVRRVLSPVDAATVRLMLTAATGEHATGANARIAGYPVAGKTGTAQKVDLKNGGYFKKAYISSFAGFVPASSPHYVIYVSLDDPKKAYYGSQVAAPVFVGDHNDLMAAAGVSPSDFGYVDYIISHESSWDGVTRWNHSGSGAYGMFQALPGSKMAVAGADWATNPVTQIRWAQGYAIGRYGSWYGAYAHWLAYHSW